MRRFFLTFTLAVFALAVQAGETSTKPSCAGFVSNGFWDNWEISAGVGIGTAISNGPDLGDWGKRIGLEGNFSVTKWIHPVVGARFQFQGGRFINFDAEQGKMKWPYVFAHLDWMVNVSNWIGGYRADRAYYAVPFIGFGYMASNFTDEMHRDSGVSTSQNFAFAYGLLNKFRMSPAVDFNIELKGLVVPSKMSAAKMGGNYLFGFSATAGFTYRFNNRGWQRAAVGYSADDIRSFQQAVADGNEALAAAQAEKARLEKELSAARTAAQAAKAAPSGEPKTVYDAGTSAIFFRIGTAKLTDRDKVQLDLIADQINKTPADKVFRIEGHADPETGTPEGNDRLAANRAKTVYDYLVSKGVEPARLTYQGKGATANPFRTSETNRVVLIR